MQPQFGFSSKCGRQQTSIRGGYDVAKQLFDASGSYAGTFPSMVPMIQPTLFLDRCRISPACRRCSRPHQSPVNQQAAGPG